MPIDGVIIAAICSGSFVLGLIAGVVIQWPERISSDALERIAAKITADHIRLIAETGSAMEGRSLPVD